MEIRQRTIKKILRASHKIEFRSNTVGISKLVPIEENSFYFNICCNQCKTVKNGVRFENVKKPIDGLIEMANLYCLCESCASQLRVEIIENFLQQKNLISNDWEVLFNIDCRGCRIDYIMCDNWKIITKSNEEFLWNGKNDFYEFDDKLIYPIGITEIDFNIKSLNDYDF